MDEADMVERVRTILTRSAEQWPRWQTGLRSLNQVHFLTEVLASISMVVFPEEDEDGIDEPEPDLSGCLYYRHFNYHEPLPEGFRCSSCWTEPACVTSEPEGGWPGDPTKGAAEAAPTFDLAAGQPARCGCLLRRRCRLGVVDVLAGDLLRGLAALGLRLFRHGESFHSVLIPSRQIVPEGLSHRSQPDQSRQNRPTHPVGIVESIHGIAITRNVGGPR